MSSPRSELEGREREHFQDKAACSVDAMLSDGIDRVNKDIETSLDPNRKERLEATSEELLEKVQLARQPLLSSDVTAEEEASAGGDDSSSSIRSNSSRVTLITSRPLISSSFNEDVVLPRRPEVSTFGDEDGFLSSVYGLCVYSKGCDRNDEGRLEGNASPGSNSSNILFVCDIDDNNNYRVVAVDAISGTLIRVVYEDGSRGSEDQLNGLFGICLLAPNTSDGNNIDDHPLLFIADSGNFRVQVVNCGTGALVGSIGCIGSVAGNGQFCPIGVAIGPSTSNTSADPLLFVTDYNNNRVQVFNAKTFAYIRTIGGGGKSPGQLTCPFGICIGDVLSPSYITGTSGYSSEYSIFVADRQNYRISVFNAASGSFIRTIGRPGELCDPKNVYYLPAGAGSSNPNGDPHIYVGDDGLERVAIFNANSGALVRYIDVGYRPLFLVPASTSEGDSFIYVGDPEEGLQIVHENNFFRVVQLLYLLNHKIFDGFVFNLNFELRDELVESLTLEML